jgi:hypothetical protein
VTRPAGTRTFGLPRWPRLLLLYCLICPPAAVLINIMFWPLWQHKPLLALGSVVLSMALLCAGILLLDELAQHSSGYMLMGSSALLTAGWLSYWRAGPLPRRVLQLRAVARSKAAMHRRARPLQFLLKLRNGDGRSGWVQVDEDTWRHLMGFTGFCEH